MDDTFELDAEHFPFKRFDFLLLSLAVLIGFAVRFYIAREAFATTFDSSTVGLMAMRILEGDRPLFFYGQVYMGALEAYTAALIFSLFGVSTMALAMAPILYALAWIVAVYLLFREIFTGERWCAFAAALTAAVSSVQGLWFTLAPYGGYPEYLFFGTLFLALSLRMTFRSLTSKSRWGHALALGVCAGLALWTNMQALVFLVTGAIFLIGALVPLRFKRAHVMPLLVGGLIGACGLVPAVIEKTRMTSLANVNAALQIENIRGGWHSFVRLLAVHLWPEDAGKYGQALVLALMLIATLYYLAAIVSADNWGARLKRLAPLLLCGVFLLLYLPNPMAQANAPRYLLPMFSVAYAAILAAGFALPVRALRVAALAPLVFMTVMQARAAIAYVNKEAPRRAALVREMNATSTAVQHLGIDHVYMVGNEVDGHMGQMYTFFARDKARFVSLFSNREQSDEISAECDQRPGFLVFRRHTDRIDRALRSAGVSDYKTRELGRTLFYDLRVDHRVEESIWPADVFMDISGNVTGSAVTLFDRNADTGLMFRHDADTQATAVITIDIGESAIVGGLDFEDFSDAGLIRAFKIEVSEDGQTYTTVRSQDELLSAYTCGNKVYMLGYNGHWQFRFDPTPGRFVRATIGLKQKAKEDWFVHEAYVLRYIDSASEVSHTEIKAIRAKADDLRLKTVTADRWLTYQLSFRSHGFSLEGMIPYPNYRYRNSHTDHKVTCHPNNGIIVARALARDTENVLRRSPPPGLVLQRTDFEHYVLFYWNGKLSDPNAAPSVQWSGLMPLQGTEVWW